MKIGQYCQRQRCRHVELEQFWQDFASRGFVSNSWAFLLSFLFKLQVRIVVGTIKCKKTYQFTTACKSDVVTHPKQHKIIFYPRDAMLARVIAIATCLSVCLSVHPSVRLSRAGIVSKRRKLAAWFLHHLVAPRLWFSDSKFHHQILRGSPRTGASNKRFFSFKRLYLENGSRYGQSYY